MVVGMQLISQPFNGQLGSHLISALSQGNFARLAVAVAFAKNSGVSRLRDAFDQFRAHGGNIDVIVGIDMEGTSYEALRNLYEVTDTLYVVHDENGQTFHTKLFSIVADSTSELIVGSHNLTLGGLWTNYESSCRIHLDHSIPDQLQMQCEVDTYFAGLKGMTGHTLQMTSADDIRELLDQGYVAKEATMHRRAKRATRSRTSSTPTTPNQRLFASGTRASFPPASPLGINATTPQTPSGHSAVPATQAVALSASSLNPVATSDPTLWMVTGAMTSGSRNQLDLSKESVILVGDAQGTAFATTRSDRMKGAVTFFDMNPTDVNRQRTITINFEGTDYTGNTITYTSNNGSWRLLLGGHSANGNKVTSAFSAAANGGKLLPNKIVTFTRLGVDYYELSVVEMEHLDDIKAKSWVIAKNGTAGNSREIGYF